MKNYKSRFLRLVALLLSLLLLCGCGTPGGSGENVASTDDTTLMENTDPTAEPSSPTDPITAEPQQPEARFYPADLTANVTLPEYDPQRTVYFDCHGWDYDFYPNGSHCYIRFYILTNEEYALEDIQVSLPLESVYSAEIIREPLFHMPERPEDTHLVYGGMPYHVYQTYQGVDWAELADLWLAAEKAKLEIETRWPNGYIMNEPPAEVFPLEQTIEAYKSALNANLETYRALTEEDLSDYYCYIVAINFDLENLVEETCETIEITLGETTYTESIGQIRVHANYKPSEGNSRGIEKYLYTATFNQHNPWGGGLAQGAGHIFEATDDLTLLGFHVEGMDAEVVGAQITISPNGYDPNVPWDISYQESELTGLQGVTTTFRVEPGKVTLSRTGALQSEMVFQEGVSHTSLYRMPFGALMLTVKADSVHYDLVPDGGVIDLVYKIDIENTAAGEIEYHLDIRAK